MTPDELAAIRERVEDNAEGDVMFGRDEVAALLAEVDRLRAQVAAVEALIARMEPWPRFAPYFEEFRAALDPADVGGCGT